MTTKYDPYVQSQIVIALANGENRKNIAERFEISQATLAKWINSETFRREYKEATQHLYRSGISLLAEGAREAAYQLRGIISDPATPAVIKIRAIDVLFRHASTVDQELQFTKALSLLSQEGLLPPGVVRNVSARIENIASEIVESLTTDTESKISESQAIQLVKSAILGNPSEGV